MNTTNRIIGLGGGLLLALGFSGCGGRSAETEEVLERANIVDQMNPEVKGWRYSEQKDEMRSQTSKIASLQAEDYNPYMTPTLVVWKKTNGKTGANIRGPMTENGTIPNCDFRTGVVSVKADQGPTQAVACNNGDTVILDPKIVKIVEKARKMTIETGTNYGPQQYNLFCSGVGALNLHDALDAGGSDQRSRQNAVLIRVGEPSLDESLPRDQLVEFADGRGCDFKLDGLRRPYQVEAKHAHHAAARRRCQ